MRYAVANDLASRNPVDDVHPSDILLEALRVSNVIPLTRQV